jgi:very-short-patch-repair endonuclease
MSFVPRPSEDTARARRLRQELTEEELRLWHQLRAGKLGVRFRRQQPIGRYVVDFACQTKRLIVEVDGSQHVESAYDRERDNWLHSQGYTILRFWNHDVLMHTDDVIDRIFAALEEA